MEIGHICGFWHQSAHTITESLAAAPSSVLSGQWIGSLCWYRLCSHWCVWLGRRLDQQSRLDERKAADEAALIDQASGVLGRAKLTLDAIHPQVLAHLPPTQVETEISKRRAEADAVRPELSVLAVKWPKGREQLTVISRFLGTAPVGLERLEFMQGTQKAAALDELVAEKDLAVSALNEVIDLLHSGTG